jgi:hypothetical protein
MNPSLPSVGSVVTRRDALKSLGAGFAFLWLGLTGGHQAEELADMRRQRGLQPLAVRALPGDALEPLFRSRSTTKLPLPW